MGEGSETSKTEPVETLVDFLMLREIGFTGSCFWYEGIVRRQLHREYGHQSRFDDIDSLKFEIDNGISFNEDFRRLYIEKHGKTTSPEQSRERLESIEKRIEESNDEEIYEACEIIAQKVEEQNPDAFYRGAISAYRSMMNTGEKWTEAMLYLNQQVRPRLKNNQNYLTTQTLEGMFDSKELAHALFALPMRWNRNIHRDGIMTSDLEEIDKERLEQDARRNALHKRILEYAEKNLEKEYLDVFMDIMGGEYFGQGGISMSPTKNKRGNVYFTLATIMTTDCGMEFSRAYGQELSDFFEETLERGLEYLDEVREKKKTDTSMFGPIYEYKSRVKEGRTEEEDNELMQEFCDAFPEYIAFSGDYFFKTKHGRSLFGKVVEIDVDKMKKEEDVDPEAKLSEMRNYLKSMIPEIENIL